MNRPKQIRYPAGQILPRQAEHRPTCFDEWTHPAASEVAVPTGSTSSNPDTDPTVTKESITEVSFRLSGN